MTQINWHSVRTIALIILTAGVAGIQAVHGMSPATESLDALLPILMFGEHLLAGNSIIPNN